MTGILDLPTTDSGSPAVRSIPLAGLGMLTPQQELDAAATRFIQAEAWRIYCTVENPDTVH